MVFWMPKSWKKPPHLWTTHQNQLALGPFVRQKTPFYIKIWYDCVNHVVNYLGHICFRYAKSSIHPFMHACLHSFIPSLLHSFTHSFISWSLGFPASRKWRCLTQGCPFDDKPAKSRFNEDRRAQVQQFYSTVKCRRCIHPPSFGFPTLKHRTAAWSPEKIMLMINWHTKSQGSHGLGKNLGNLGEKNVW